MSAPRLLDTFCKAGGAGMGYAQAGFEVTGVDCAPQPRYPFRFIQGDALEYIAAHGQEYDAIHASPPCQRFTVYGNNRQRVRSDHPDLIAPVRELLRATGRPYVIENVPGAPLVGAVVRLCGTSFGLPVRRHRHFEVSSFVLAPPCNHGAFRARVYPGSSNRPNGRTVCNVGEWRVPLRQQQEAMGIDWMTLEEISQAIPPVFTRFIGAHLLRVVEGGGQPPSAA